MGIRHLPGADGDFNFWKSFAADSLQICTKQHQSTTFSSKEALYHWGPPGLGREIAKSKSPGAIAPSKRYHISESAVSDRRDIPLDVQCR